MHDDVGVSIGCISCMYFFAQDLDAALPLIEKYEEHLVAIGEVTYTFLKGAVV